MAISMRHGVRQEGSGRRRARNWKRYSGLQFHLFVAPWLVIGFLGLTVVPLGYALGLSFTNFDGFSGHWHWVGWSNYNEAFGDSATWHGLWRTALLALITVPVGTAMSLGLAVLLNQKIRGIYVFRTLFYMPAIVPIVASALMWREIFDRDTGILNGVIERLGANIVLWLQDPYAFWALVVMVLWGVGGGMIIFLAALQGVPNELRESAAIDGAGPVRRFLNVDLPLLSPVLFFMVLMSAIGSMQTMIQPFLLASTGGSSNPSQIPAGNQLYMINVYTQVFYNFRFGYGSALLWMLFVVVLALTVVIFRTSSLWVYYEVEAGGAKG
jgi:multiple sugar transport system permease protein